MKATHRSDIWAFSSFDEARNLDFNGYLVRRREGNVLVDPVPMLAHDVAHTRDLGGVAWIVITNSDHVRDAALLAKEFDAKIAGPAAERESFALRCDRWLEGGDPLAAGIEVVALAGSKTPGELALVIDDVVLITGDLIRGQRGGTLNLLPDAKLGDRDAALASVRALAARERLDAVLVGDGWPVFRDGRARLLELATAR